MPPDMPLETPDLFTVFIALAFPEHHLELYNIWPLQIGTFPLVLRSGESSVPFHGFLYRFPTPFGFRNLNIYLTTDCENPQDRLDTTPAALTDLTFAPSQDPSLNLPCKAFRHFIIPLQFLLHWAPLATGWLLKVVGHRAMTMAHTFPHLPWS